MTARRRQARRRRWGIFPLLEWDAQLSRIEYRYRGRLDVKSQPAVYRAKTLKEKQSKGKAHARQACGRGRTWPAGGSQWADPAAVLVHSPLDDEQLDELLSQPATYLFVYEGVPTGAEDDSPRILGMLTLATFIIPTGKRAWIEDVVVDSAARGQGAGQALVEAAIAHAKKIGAKSVDLTSRPSREAANRLYVRSGFTARQTNIYRYGG